MIRHYQPTDFDQIIKIYDAVKLERSRLNDPLYEANIQKNGYLLGLDTPNNIREEISNSYITLVYEDDSQILGYLIADHSDKQKFMDDEYKTWFDQNLKSIYYSDPKCMTLAVIATLPNSSQKGVATKLLQEFESKLIFEKFTYLFSIVNVAPITNCASIIWHSKNGFHRLGMARPREKLMWLDWYSSVLFYKKLSNNQ